MQQQMVYKPAANAYRQQLRVISVGLLLLCCRLPLQFVDVLVINKP